MALKKEVSELRAKLASQEEDYHKSESEMHAEVRNKHYFRQTREVYFCAIAQGRRRTHCVLCTPLLLFSEVLTQTYQVF